MQTSERGVEQTIKNPLKFNSSQKSVHHTGTGSLVGTPSKSIMRSADEGSGRNQGNAGARELSIFACVHQIMKGTGRDFNARGQALLKGNADAFCALGIPNAHGKHGRGKA